MQSQQCVNSAQAVPSLKRLYERDFVIKNAVNKGGFMLIVAAGFRWFAPSGTPPPGVDLSFEIAMSKWVPVGAVVLAATALIVLVWRWRWIKRVLVGRLALLQHPTKCRRPCDAEAAAMG